MLNPLAALYKQLFLERPARDRAAGDLIADLETSGQLVAEKIAAAPESDANRAVLRHMVGIESWALRRLRTLSGLALIMDEHDDYQPSKATPWADLQASFAETRRLTVDGLRELLRSGIAPTAAAEHNQLGELTFKGWAVYIRTHAEREVTKLK